MTITAIFFGAVYVLGAILLLSLHIASRWHWWYKGAALAILTVLALLFYEEALSLNITAIFDPDIAVFFLVAAYVIVAVLLLSMNIAARYRWWIKAGTIILTTVFFVFSYNGIVALLGWPSNGALPSKFKLHWATVVEPDKFTGAAGSIYLWIEELDDENIPFGVPRAYRLPYSDELADSVGGALEQIEEGGEQGGEAGTLEELLEELEEEAEEEEGEELGELQTDDESGSFDAEAFIEPDQSIQFGDLPPPELPPKEIL
jgi:hypothetical protein